MLWTGKSGPRPRRRWLLYVLVPLAYYGMQLLISVILDQDPGYLVRITINAGICLVGFILLLPLFGRRQLSTGRYTVTDRRIVVEGRISGFPVRRSENLAELRTPELRDGSVAFGDRKSGKLAGHRPNGRVIASLVLYRIPEPEHVLEIIREAQARL
ncbi:hypothetical protein GCM10017566_58960 [Amycolatopsis bartoniae]|uniref:PH domain-containing protein n=1 Tax=Amycolatopsis bartoniae TaxID=941986 RepID=A0A8H9J0B4_9PSEU|nr:hypothetical protein GCM10017566_58960 [Amycolatopsis bartoniae]